MMRAISLWQPWASLMANGSKRNETRGGVTKVRGEVAICASKKWTNQLKELCYSSPFSEGLVGDLFKGMGGEVERMTQVMLNTPLGCVVAVGELYDSITSEEWIRLHADALRANSSSVLRELRFGNYAPGRGVWRFRKMRKLAKPVPCKGAQQWFNLPPDVEAAVRAQLK